MGKSGEAAAKTETPLTPDSTSSHLRESSVRAGPAAAVPQSGGRRDRSPESGVRPSRPPARPLLRAGTSPRAQTPDLGHRWVLRPKLTQPGPSSQTQAPGEKEERLGLWAGWPSSRALFPSGSRGATGKVGLRTSSPDRAHLPLGAAASVLQGPAQVLPVTQLLSPALPHLLGPTPAIPRPRPMVLPGTLPCFSSALLTPGPRLPRARLVLHPIPLRLEDRA